jgi:hypothetical protein
MKPQAATTALMETVVTTITAQTAAGSMAEGAVVGEETVAEAETDRRTL